MQLVNLGESSELTQKIKCPFTTGMESLNHFSLFLAEFEVADSERAAPATWPDASAGLYDPCVPLRGAWKH